ncbi:MAG: hypothetical protein AAF533_05500 [Acidobacteriota bacterium]
MGLSVAGLSMLSCLRLLDPMPSEQVRDMTGLRDRPALVERYHEVHGRYPATLDETLALVTETDPTHWRSSRDGRGVPLAFASGEDWFVIVALGRDRALDEGMTIESYLDAEYRNVCGDLDADQVITHQSWVRSCGK